MIEENQSFREATLKVCGSLDIEKALGEVLLYIRQFIAADALFLLNVYDPGLGVIEAITGAGEFVRKFSFPFRIPMSQAAKKIIDDERAHPGKIPQVRAIDRLDGYELSKPVARVFNAPDASALSLLLQLDERSLGFLVVLNLGGEKFTEAQGNLMALLNELGS